MQVTYRALLPSEEEAVIRLWVDILGDDWEMRSHIFRDFTDDPQRFARTHVAVAEDGTLLSAVAYWLRELCGPNHTVCRTGHLWGVATRPEARRQGHARRLLELASDAMQREGCQWSILFARDEARDLYLHAGWQSLPNSYRAGVLLAEHEPVNSAYVIQRIDSSNPSQIWTQLATIYAEYNTQRPLTVVRTREYWHGYAAWMLTDWIKHHRAVILVATPATSISEWCGYVVVHYYDFAYAHRVFGSPSWFFISEIGVRTNEPQAASALLNGVAAEALRQGMGYGQMALPRDLLLDVTLKGLFGETLEEHQEMGAMMVRTLTPDTPKIKRLYEDTTAFYWSLDRF